MKWLKCINRIVVFWSSCVAILFLVIGCQTASNLPPASNETDLTSTSLGRLRPDDLVSVVYSGTPSPPERFEGRIKEDGHISLPFVGNVMAAGKTTGELEKDILSLYVPKLYHNLSVNVNSENRFFFVDREVKMPNRYVYSGHMTVLRAIASAGGFTDFANKKKVKLIRANREFFTVNCIKAQSKPELDLQVFPGDKIVVPRRFTGN